jgi:phage replication O-like protein O
MTSSNNNEGFLKMPNEIVDAFTKLQLSGYQWRILMVIIRKTNGWNKSTDRIALSVFEEYTGLERRNLNKNLNALIKRGIITKDSSGYMTRYGLQGDWTKWQMSVNNNTSVKSDTTTSVENDTETSVNNDTHKRQKTIKYSPDSDKVRMSELLFSLIHNNNPLQEKPDIQEWAEHIDCLVKKDNRSVEDIEKIIKWCQDSEFWGKIILSAEKLKKHFGTLWNQSGFEKRKSFF